jgi:hypothetical protein
LRRGAGADFSTAASNGRTRDELFNETMLFDPGRACMALAECTAT